MELTTDPIIAEQEAKRVFDFNDEDNLIYLINGLSDKAKATMGRVQINQDLSTAIKETHRGQRSPMIFLRAPVYNTDLSTHDLTVKVYIAGVLNETYSANDVDLVVTTDDFYSRVDLVGGCFPCLEGADYIEVEYFGGWATVPGDVVMGAIYQGRVDLKRMAGEVGVQSHSANGESIQMDRNGVIKEAASLWQKYKVLS